MICRVVHHHNVLTLKAGLDERPGSKDERAIARRPQLPKWRPHDAEFSVHLALRDLDLIFTLRDRTGEEHSFGERNKLPAKIA